MLQESWKMFSYLIFVFININITSYKWQICFPPMFNWCNYCYFTKEFFGNLTKYEIFFVFFISISLVSGKTRLVWLVTTDNKPKSSFLKSYRDITGLPFLIFDWLWHIINQSSVGNSTRSWPVYFSKTWLI